MKIIDRGCIFNSAEGTGPKRVCSFTSLLKPSSGKILATFRLGSSKESAVGNCRIAESTDEGFSWEIICDGFETVYNGCPYRELRTSMKRLESGRLLVDVMAHKGRNQRRSSRTVH